MVNSSTLTQMNASESSEFCEVDSFIDEVIENHKDNTELLSVMALEATSLATNVTSRSKELEEQSTLKRLWGSIRGTNAKVAARNQMDLAQSQYLGQQMLNKLAENNLMTYQMTVMLGDRVNRAIDETNRTKQEVAKIYQTLASFFSDLRNKLEQRFTKLERNQNLLYWKETMMFESVYQGREYEQLSQTEVVVCLANEFYRHSDQTWGPRDLSLLKSIIVQLGFRPEQPLAFSELFNSYQSDKGLLSQLFFALDTEQQKTTQPDLEHATELTPILLAFNKLQRLEEDEAHIVKSVSNFCPETPVKEIRLELTSSYLNQITQTDLNKEVTMFDAVMGLVEDLTIFQQQKLVNKENLTPVSLEKNAAPKDTLPASAAQPAKSNVPANILGRVKTVEIKNFFESTKGILFTGKFSELVLLSAFVESPHSTNLAAWLKFSDGKEERRVNIVSKADLFSSTTTHKPAFEPVPINEASLRAAAGGYRTYKGSLYLVVLDLKNQLTRSHNYAKVEL